MPSKKLKIILENVLPQGYYFPGQTILGLALLRLDEPIKTTEITVKQGRSEVTCFVVELIVKTRQLIFGDDKSHEEVPGGEHILPFTFSLPESINLSDSFMGSGDGCRSRGTIEYLIEALVKRPLFQDDLRAREVFKVRSPFMWDVGLGKWSESKTMGCLCWESLPVGMIVKLRKEGNPPRESLIVEGQLNNESDRSITHVSAKLKRTTMISAQGRIVNDREMNSVLVETSCVMEEDRFQMKLKISQEVPIVLVCNIIRSVYTVEVEANVSGCGTNLVVSCPVTIQNVEQFTNMYGDGLEEAKNSLNEACLNN